MRRLRKKSRKSWMENSIVFVVLAVVVGAGAGTLVGAVSQHKSSMETTPIANK